MFEKLGKILIPIAIIVAGLLIAGAFIFVNQGQFKKLVPEETLASEQIAEKVINYINQNKDTLTGGNAASLVNIVEDGEVYKIRLKIAEREYDSYVTKDGKLLFPDAYNLEEEKTTEETSGGSGASIEVQKRDNPDVKVFIMSYCPYGLQAQKMFLPVYDLLKNKAEMGIYFVNYIMHEKQEIDENLAQYCIQKEDKEKYSNYLNCFVISGDSEKCLSQANIDKTKLSACIAETDAQYKIYSQYNDKSTWLNGNFPKFDVNSDLNNQYGVQGSPTIVINDKIVNVSSRSPEKFKEVVCQSFNSAPEECSQTLSNEVASTGIGGGTANSSGGGCGQ